MSILILEKNRVLRDGLSMIPSHEVDVFDFNSNIVSIKSFEMADVIILVDSYDDDPHWVVLKDRYSVPSIVGKYNDLETLSDFVDGMIWKTFHHPEPEEEKYVPPPCPFCGADFGFNGNGEFAQGCMNDDCAQHPTYCDPIGRPDYVEEWWKDVIKEADKVKAEKRRQLALLQYQVERFYS